jgi:glycosyltransferase involved in cell wall biosynthesis
VQLGDGERVVAAMHDSFPAAPIYTTVALPRYLPPELRGADIRTSAMQRLPALEQRFSSYFMLYPFAVEHFDVSDYDLIFSSSLGYAKGVRRRPNAVHVCYSHTPLPWLNEEQRWEENFGRAARTLLPLALWGLKKWDLRAAQQPNYYIANSRLAAARIKQAYGREAFVIPPPIDVDKFELSPYVDDYYLVLSRLYSHNQIELAIEACQRLNRRLVIIGDGPDRGRLEKLAGPKTEFLGNQPDHRINYLAGRCRALLSTGVADFAMAPLEVNAAGRPVIALRAGGALETMAEGVTGLFYDRSTCVSLVAAMEDFESRTWCSSQIRRHAEKFDRSVFSFRVLQFLASVAPSSCVGELTAGARLLSGRVASRAWPRLAVAR